MGSLGRSKLVGIWEPARAWAQPARVYDVSCSWRIAHPKRFCWAAQGGTSQGSACVRAQVTCPQGTGQVLWVGESWKAVGKPAGLAEGSLEHLRNLVMTLFQKKGTSCDSSIKITDLVVW